MQPLFCDVHTGVLETDAQNFYIAELSECMAVTLTIFWITNLSPFYIITAASYNGRKGDLRLKLTDSALPVLQLAL